MNYSSIDSENLNQFSNLIKNFLFYANVIIVPLGIIFNILTILVFSRKQFRANTLGFYYRIIGVFDIIAITMTFFNYFGYSIKYEFELKSNVSCKLIHFLNRISFQVSAWLNVMVTIDRLISLKYPNRRINFFQTKNCCIVIGIFSLACILNGPNLLLELVTKQTNLTSKSYFVQCTSNSAELLFYIDLVNILSRMILPFILMIIINTLLILTLFASKSKIKHKIDTKIKREHNFALSLIILNLFFLVNLIPYSITTVLVNLSQFKTLDKLIIAALAFVISSYIALLNNVLPFLIHLKFNKLFAKEFASILKLSIANKIDAS